MLRKCMWKQLIRKWNTRAWPLIAMNHFRKVYYSELQFYFSTDLPSWTCLSCHIGFSVCGSGQKVTFFAPTCHSYSFRKFEPYVLYSSLSAVCLESLVEIRSAVLEYRHRRWGRAPRTGPRVGTNSPTFLGHGLADFCAVFTIRYKLYPTRITQRCFF